MIGRVIALVLASYISFNLKAVCFTRGVTRELGDDAHSMWDHIAWEVLRDIRSERVRIYLVLSLNRGIERALSKEYDCRLDLWIVT